jgi:thiamine-monophosphate kinase
VSLSEDSLIARYFAPLAGEGGLKLADDAALLVPPAGQDLVLTKDMLAAGVHFFADDPPASIARKALAVNLSDLAAKGAKPVGFLLGLALPKGLDEAWVAAFAAGLGDMAQAFGCPLFGGDTIKAAGGLTISITAFGSVAAGRMVRRTAAQAGDILAVTGTIGDAALGLRLRLEDGTGWTAALSAAARAHLADRYLHPQPRNAVADLIRAHARAAMDVSDGLLGDATKLCASAVTEGRALRPEIRLQAIPLSPPAAAALATDPALMQCIASGGDDYEVLMAVAPAQLADLVAGCAAQGVTVTPIGRVLDGAGPGIWLDATGQEVDFASLSFQHGWG